MQKAEAFLSQVETMKGAVRGLYYERADPALVDDAACAMRVLQSLKVQGTPLSGDDPAQDAHTLGYAALDLGTFDIVDGSGTVVGPGRVTGHGDAPEQAGGDERGSLRPS